jgi:hypothetical protein
MSEFDHTAAEALLKFLRLAMVVGLPHLPADLVKWVRLKLEDLYENLGFAGDAHKVWLTQSTGREDFYAGWPDRNQEDAVRSTTALIIRTYKILVEAYFKLWETSGARNEAFHAQLGPIKECSIDICRDRWSDRGDWFDRHPLPQAGDQLENENRACRKKARVSEQNRCSAEEAAKPYAPPEFEDLFRLAIEELEREAELPPLTANTKRLLFMQIQNRRKARGFAGREHEKWPNSPERREQAALTFIRGGFDYYACVEITNGSQVRAFQLKHKDDLETIDLIGKEETAELLVGAFKDAAGIYSAAWEKIADARWEELRTWLEWAKQALIAAGRKLWRGRPFLPDLHLAANKPLEEEFPLWFDRLPLRDANDRLDKEIDDLIEGAHKRELKRRKEAGAEMISSNSATATPAQTEITPPTAPIANGQEQCPATETTPAAPSGELPRLAAAEPPAEEQELERRTTYGPLTSAEDMARLKALGGKPQEEPPKPEIEATDWADIEILFLSDHRIQVRSGSHSETYNWGDFGFVDRRSNKPDSHWGILRALARLNGVLRTTSEAGCDWRKVEKSIQTIRQRLRERFHLDSDPLPFVKKGEVVKGERFEGGYVAQFNIGTGPSFEQ